MVEVNFSRDGNVAVLALRNPPVNALGLEHRVALAEAIDRAAHDEAVDAIVLVGDGKGFAAGADIAQFASGQSRIEPRLKAVQAMLPASGKLTVAAIHGFALGGGLELALACDARVAVASAQIGLPEVTLGILPGAGGTQRIPRLCGPKAAIALITTGRPVSASRALELGIIDALVEDARQGGVDFARKALAEGRTFVPALQRDDRNGGVDAAFFREARLAAGRKARGAVAPAAIVDCIEAACLLPPEEGLAVETAKFEELLRGEQAPALMHLFFAEREARKVPGLAAGESARPVERAGVIGAGTMGGGIAMVFANAGIDVTLVDADEAALARGLATIRGNYDMSVSRGSTARETADTALQRIRPTTDYADLGGVDLVVEAVFEDMALKRQIFAKLDAVTSAHAILASNTSSLDIDAIAAATRRPERVIGMHFFSPANVMRLLEVVRGAATAAGTIKAVMALSTALRKIPVLAGNCDGFIGNRMLQYYAGEAEFLLEEGATPEQIDRVATDFGMAIGPISMRDLAGIDVAVSVRRGRASSLPPEERLSPILERLVAVGRLGVKVGKGFYRYEGRERFADPETLAIIEAVAAEQGIARRPIDDEEVRERLFLPLVNEGAKVLEQGIALRAGDIDVVWVNGYGFPAYRGGPMFWGERIGLERVRAMAARLAARSGPRWAPAPLLDRLIRAGKGFAAVDDGLAG